MAFQRPTLSELVDRIQQDFVSRLNLIGAVLRRSLVYVLSRVLAGAAHMLHGHLEFLSKQIFPDLSESTYLIRQAALFGLSPNAPTFAKATATVTGTNGTIIPAGEVLTRSDAVEYTVDADVTIAAGTGTIAVTASLADANSTLVAATSLSFQSPIPGASATAAVITSTSDGTDSETVDALRIRLLARMQEPPHGGNAADYVAWAKEVSGVTRAWCYPLEGGAGTVTVRFVRDNDVDLIPSSGEVADVQAYIDGLAPVTADVTVVAPIATPLDMTVSITPDTTDTRAAVTAEFADLIARMAEPGGEILLSDIQTAVKEAAGVTDRVITLPAADVTRSTGELTTPGVITFV